LQFLREIRPIFVSSSNYRFDNKSLCGRNCEIPDTGALIRDCVDDINDILVAPSRARILN
jgi:hypothetical protein